MDQSLKNSIINIFKEEQDQMDGALDNKSDVKAPDTITEYTVTQNSDGTWSKNERTKKPDFYDGSVDKKNRDKVKKKAKDLQAFCREIDNKILDFNSQIDAKKQQLVSLTAQAKTANCWVGTAHSLPVGGISKYYGTDIAFNGEVENIKIYPKMAGPQQDNNAKNVFDPDTIYTLNDTYSGYGYKNLPERVVYENTDGVGTGSSIDGSGSSLGAVKFDISKIQSDHNARSFSSVGVGTNAIWTWYYDGATSPATCVSIANSIDSIYDEIISLRKERNALRRDLNVIKDKKMEKELASWGLNRVASEVKERKTVHTSVINAINSFNDDITVNDKSLVLYLDAGDNDSYSGVGTSWYDLNGSGKVATLVNGPTYDYANGGSIVFVEIPNLQYATVSTSTVTAHSNNPFTLESWAKNTLSGLTAVGPDREIGFHNGQFLYGGNGGAGNTLRFAGTNTIGNWYHLVMTFEGLGDKIAKFYVNGVLIDANSIGDNGATSTSTIRIGSYSTSGSEFLTGNVAIARIYNKCLSAAEVTQNFNDTKGRFNIS
jgi:hypothetical protein